MRSRCLVITVALLSVSVQGGCAASSLSPRDGEQPNRPVFASAAPDDEGSGNARSLAKEYPTPATKLGFATTAQLVAVPDSATGPVILGNELTSELVRRSTHYFYYEGNRKKYDVLLGRSHSEGGAANGRFVRDDTPWSFEVTGSWAMLWGYWPYAETSRVIAGAPVLINKKSSTAVTRPMPPVELSALVQIDSSSNRHRIIRMNNGGPITVQSKLVPYGEDASKPPYRETISTAYDYCDVTSDGRISAPASINNNPELVSFRDYVNALKESVVTP